MARAAVTLESSSIFTIDKAGERRYIDCRYLDYVTFQVVQYDNAASWTTGSVKVKVSNDGKTWFDPPTGAVAVTGANTMTSKVDVYAFRYVGLETVTAQASINLRLVVHGEGQSADSNGVPNDTGLGGFVQLGSGNFSSGYTSAGYGGSTTSETGGPPM